MRIFKYSVNANALPDGFMTTSVTMPEGGKILSCKIINGQVFVWALVDEKAQTRFRRFGVVGTGFTLLSEEDVDNSTFIATVVDGGFIWHVFDLGEK